jgi:hypothetical protein
LLTAAFIVNTRAKPGATKIETQYGNAQGVERLGRLIGDFVVHCSAEQWMRMADDRGQVRNAGMVGSPEDGLQAADRSVQKEGLGSVRTHDDYERKIQCNGKWSEQWD